MVQIPRWQVILIAVVLLVGVAFAAPNLLKSETAEGLPGWLPSDQVSLGLDLQGGSYLLLDVDLEFVFREQLENLVEGVRIALRRARLGYNDLGVAGEAVVFTLLDPTKSEEVRGLVSDIAQDVLISASDDGSVRLSFTEQALRQRRDNVLNQSIEIVRRRIDETGTREPSIQRQGAGRSRSTD